MMLYIIIIIIIIYVMYYHKSEYETPIKFLSAEETRNLILVDSDGFISSLNKLDLFARHVDTKDQYMQKILHSALDFTQRDIDILTQNAKEADKYTSKLNVPWIFAKTTEVYEEGFPHTRSGVIFMSEPLDTKTLVHEKFHVYEKATNLNPEEYGFKRVGLRKDVHRLRSNPDVDQYVYKDLKGNLMVGVYNSDRPMGLTDAKNVGTNEHPYEYLAYHYM